MISKLPMTAVALRCWERVSQPAQRAMTERSAIVDFMLRFLFNSYSILDPLRNLHLKVVEFASGLNGSIAARIRSASSSHSMLIFTAAYFCPSLNRHSICSSSPAIRAVAPTGIPGSFISPPASASAELQTQGLPWPWLLRRRGGYTPAAVALPSARKTPGANPAPGYTLDRLPAPWLCES